MSAIPSSYSPSPQSTGPPMGIIIGGVVLVIVVIVLIVLWQTGAFGGGGVGASPSPGAPSPSVSQNAMNIKKYYDGALPVPCPNFTTAIGTWGDSVGMQAVPVGQNCPVGTIAAQGVTNTNGLQICVVPGVSQNPPQNIIAMYSTCITSASSGVKNIKDSKNFQTTAATCNCPTGYTYDPSQPVNKRCVNPQGTAPESCNCPTGYRYNSTGLVGERCEFREKPKTMMASPAPMVPSP